MATTTYCTVDQVKAEVGIDVGTTTHDIRIGIAIAAASQQIDGQAGRRFWIDDSVTVRYYEAVDGCRVEVDDIATTTGLIVAYDSSIDGTYGQTVTVNAGYVLGPYNAAVENPVRPYEWIEFLNGYTVPVAGRPTLKVTAKFGWPAVPDAIEKACIVQAVQLFKAGDAVFGGLQLSPELGGVLRVKAQLNPLAAGLVEPFVRLQ